MPQNSFTVTDTASGEQRPVELGAVNQLTFSAQPMASHATEAAPMQPEPSHLPNAPMPFVRASSQIERVNSAIGNVYDAASNELKQLGPVGVFAQSLGLDPSGVMSSWANPDQPMTAPLPLPGEPIKGVYSRIDEHVLNALKGTESPSRIKTLIGSMASPEEAQLRGLTEWLDTKPPSSRINKSEVQEFLAAHPMPQVSEIQLGSSPYRQRLSADIESLRHKRDTNGLTNGEDSRLRDLEDEFDRSDQGGAGSSPRWDREDVNLPGGSQYREYVFTLPRRQAPPSQPEDLFAKGYRAIEKDYNEHTGQRTVRIYGPQDDRFQPMPPFVAERSGTRLTPEEVLDEHALSMAAEKSKAAEKRLNYTSGHWSGITNPVAHLRMDDRVTVHGEPAALIQEGQSDWGMSLRDRADDIKVARRSSFDGIIDRMKRAGVLTVECE